MLKIRIYLSITCCCKMVNGVRNMLVVTEKGSWCECLHLYVRDIRARIPARNCSPSTKRLPHAQAIASSDRESNAKNANDCKICSIFPPTTSLLDPSLR